MEKSYKIYARLKLIYVRQKKSEKEIIFVCRDLQYVLHLDNI